MGAVQQWIGRCIRAIKFRLNSPRLGQQAENLAANYLQQQGLKLIKKNYLTKAGEIDLIMQDNATLVFVEVKFRSRQDWAHAAETVTRAKQKRIINAAKHYLQQQKQFDRVFCRFDVLAINKQLNEAEVEWFQHAFE